MCFRKPLVTALAVVLLGAATVVPTGAHANATHKMYVTFSAPVALPGVSLGTGTYVFEIPDAIGDHRLVRVTSMDRKIVYFTAFTALVERPAGMKRDRVISFAETPADRPQPIDIWWPEEAAGRKFIYPKK